MKTQIKKVKPTRIKARTGLLLALTAVDLMYGFAAAQAATAKLDQGLAAYDAAITADTTATAVAKLTTPAVLDGTAGKAFNFGATFGDATMEFILQGDPAISDVQYIAVGENTTSSLRFEQWQNTRQVGFTQAGIADYLFTPSSASPAYPTHLAYAWNATDSTMTLYVNGVLAGTTTGVTADFALPTGEGFLGSDQTGGAAMAGTIYRATVYLGVLADTAIKSHANAFASVALPIIGSFTAAPAEIPSQGSSVLRWQVQNATSVFLNGALVTVTNQSVSPAVTTAYTLMASNEVAVTTAQVKVMVNPRLDDYDAAIAADKASGLTPLALLTNTVTLTGTNSEAFDFGANSGDVTMEFILEGDADATGDSGYLAVGENSTSSLRYEQWQDTHVIGFTQAGVADYTFVPSIASPSIATHVVYVWNAAAFSMKVYVNGVASNPVNGVNDAFAMPTGPGFLGTNPGGGEAMIGRIFRVVVYDDILPEAAIKRHAEAFTSVLRPPLVTSFTADPAEILGQGSSVLRWQVQNATAVYLNNANVTATTNQTVAPSVSTTYTLIASNSISTATAKVTVLVTPILAPYDAVIAADKASGLVPISQLTNAVTLTGTGAVPFDFGATSGDITMEFIVEGDPAGRSDGYLAVGENSSSNLRYAQWENTGQVGFTQLGVADYLFTPPIYSPTAPTHLVYVWNAAEFSMNLYTNGVLAGTATGVSDSFAMPTGAGFLGATAGGGEGMVGRIFRLVTYPGLLPAATIQKHANALGGARGPSLSLVVAGGKATLTLQGTAGTHYRVEFSDSLAATTSWQLLQDVPSLTGSTLQVNDTTSTAGRSQRFYRASVVQ
ncbi:MAG: LamG-like jellyroll fold domain-containing protein [Verrucomicrobiota bacterium]